MGDLAIEPPKQVSDVLWDLRINPPRSIIFHRDPDAIWEKIPQEVVFSIGFHRGFDD